MQLRTSLTHPIGNPQEELLVCGKNGVIHVKKSLTAEGGERRWHPPRTSCSQRVSFMQGIPRWRRKKLVDYCWRNISREYHKQLITSHMFVNGRSEREKRRIHVSTLIHEPLFKKPLHSPSLLPPTSVQLPLSGVQPAGSIPLDLQDSCHGKVCHLLRHSCSALFLTWPSSSTWASGSQKHPTRGTCPISAEKHSPWQLKWCLLWVNWDCFPCLWYVMCLS